MKAKCIKDIAYFTKGAIYDVSHIDSDGDIWVEEDDQGDPMFMYPEECKLIKEEGDE